MLRMLKLSAYATGLPARLAPRAETEIAQTPRINPKE